MTSNTEMAWQTALVQGIAALGLKLDSAQQAALQTYVELLQKWNKAYNLTAVRDPLQMVYRHLLDSLSVAPYIEHSRLLDVGSGPGLPGIPLAICFPDLQVTSLDSNSKKTRFQLQVKAELGLTNLEVINARAENAGLTPFPQVISRAFASLQDMIQWTDALCAENGVFLAMKGLYPEDEINALPQGFTVKQTYPLRVPGVEGERHLLVLGRH
ncbi:16S rRNA (guanine(527)-N(7))-methyltransferase RsmG [Pontibacter sp. JAM-7]|uniref:16S rRNA (guanine(527)-N(7))-methyltransferase RsmG n=1 Tax=Pontibacter sp. JAM-7 TaxID=3366581 RepID=UPI003AF657DD